MKGVDPVMVFDGEGEGILTHYGIKSKGSSGPKTEVGALKKVVGKGGWSADISC